MFFLKDVRFSLIETYFSFLKFPIFLEPFLYTFETFKIFSFNFQIFENVLSL
jgi:hypothetical protein